MENKEHAPVYKESFKEKAIRKLRDAKKNVNITRELVKKNVKIQYRNSVIGIFWTVLNPFLNMLVMFFVFGSILGYSESDKTYALYLLCGNIVFNMMRGATSQSLTSLVQNRGLLTKNKISYYVFPLSNNLSALVNFLFSCIALLGVMVFVHFYSFGQLQGSVFSVNILLAFLMLPALLLFNYGISMVLAAMYVFFRDIQHFYSVFLTLWTYLTPIFYKTEKLEPWMVFVLKLNPMYHFVQYFRDVIYYVSSTGTSLSTGGAYPSFGGELLKLYLIGLAFFTIGVLVYNLTKRKYIFYI